MEIAQFEFLWKDAASGGGGSPSISRVTEGPEGYIVVGKILGDETAGRVQGVAADEVASFIPANVIDRLRDLP